MVGALIVMLPSLVAQPLSEAVMYLFGIDMNINSLPVAAVGIGIGIDYGYYVLSRIVEELCARRGLRHRHPAHVPDHREDRALHRRVADGEHHLLGASSR